MSVNQLLRPITFDNTTTTTIGGCSLSELAKKYGTPLYVIDEKSLRKIANEYKDAFSDCSEIKILFALKSNCNLAVASILNSEGIGFDAVSSGELYTLIKAGVDLKNVLFNGNNKTKEELTFALENNIGRISVDNFLELKQLNSLCEKYNKNADILLRITPGIECHTHEYIKTGQIDSKFGFDMSQIDEAINLIRNNYKNLNLKGLHSHIGSQIFETKSYYDEIDIVIKELARINSKFGVALDEVNIGGGLGVKYTDEDLPPSIEEYAKVVKSAIKEFCGQNNIKLSKIYIEPGRSLISTSGVTLYTVGSSKQVPNGRKYIAVDGGMADNPRPAMYNAKYSVMAVDNNSQETEEVTIGGRYCESGDIIIENVLLPKLAEGDILCIFNTGAYNYSMASNYNKFEKPAMVLVNNSQSDIIVNRESKEDLIRNEHIPDRLKI